MNHVISAVKGTSKKTLPPLSASRASLMYRDGATIRRRVELLSERRLYDRDVLLVGAGAADADAGEDLALL